MDNFENASPPQESEDMVFAKCWECGSEKTCREFVVCCTGTMFHYCDECLRAIRSRPEQDFASKKG